MSADINPKVAGIRAGYHHDGGGGIVNSCPYPLWQGTGKTKVRHPDRDAWFDGFRIGLALGDNHRSELKMIIKLHEATDDT